MKKLFGLVALLALSFILPARAETVNMFALNMNALNNNKISPARAEVLNAMLANDGEPMAFGYFYNIKSTDYFNLVNDGYVFEKNSGGKYVFAHQVGMTVVTEYTEFTKDNNHPIRCFVVEDAQGNKYAPIFYVGNSYDKLTYWKPLWDAADTVVKDYPTARVYVVLMQGYWGTSTTLPELQKYIMAENTGVNTSGMGMVLVADGNGEGGYMYAHPDATRTVSGGAIAVGSEETYLETFKAIVCKAMYAAGCTVTFRDWDGTILSIDKIAQGGDATPPEDPVREGYNFAGWDGDYTHVTEDREVVATYAIKTFDVQFVAVNEAEEPATTNVLKQETVEWGAAATAPADPVREGSKFLGWEPADFSCVKEDLVVVAQFEELSNIFTVRFLDSDGETVLKEEDVVGGEAATAPENPTPKSEDELFYGWNPADFSTIISNTDIVAVYGPKTIEVGTVEDFASVAGSANAAATVVLTDDLDFTGSSYAAPDFVAILEGNGHSVTGFADSKNLFGKVYGAIRNLRVCNVDILMADYERGLLGGQAYGARVENVTFENCKMVGRKTNASFGLFFASATTNGLGVSTVISNCVVRNCQMLLTNSGIQGIKCGGFIGSAGGQTHIVDCQFLADNADDVTVGGDGAMGAGSFVGEAVGAGITVERCLAEGKVYAPRCYGNSSGAGGLVCGVNGLCKIYDCTNRATVVGAHQNGNGGIVGRGCKAPVGIYRSVNYGSVTTGPRSDGLNPVAIGAGGILGGCWGAGAGVTIVDCANFGAVSATTNNVPAGGIIGSLSGQNTCVSNCMNYASVFAPTNSAGGVIGNAASSTIVICNVGNAGDVTCPLGAVGGAVGKNEFLNNNVHDYVYGFMQYGTLMTESGYSGEIFGLRVGAQNAGCSVAVKNSVLAGSVVAGEDGRTGLLVAGTSPLGTGGEVTYSVDAATHVLDTTLVHYYDKSDEPCLFADPLTEMSAADLTRKNGATKWLNDYAAEKGLMPWVRGRNFPELELWGTPYNFGMVLLVR